MKNYHKVPMIYQRAWQECGAACLAMVLEYYGKSVPYELLCDKTILHDEKWGGYTSAGQIHRASWSFDLECHAFRRGVGDLLEIRFPRILHWKMNRFVVLDRADEAWFWVCDPAMGRRKVSRKEMDEGFTGVVLTFRPAEQFLQD